ncbi:hypothetical protein CGMCC3_g583 [Colletotrichum fructicola]|nr:uncharacterized protein CGMCC3_g583 [Colletotrichum fructicola]KAE9583861.1 hypothetical protein CGMCC3_g583 [Colletotrichum fructicola]
MEADVSFDRSTQDPYSGGLRQHAIPSQSRMVRALRPSQGHSEFEDVPVLWMRESVHARGFEKGQRFGRGTLTDVNFTVHTPPLPHHHRLHPRRRPSRPSPTVRLLVDGLRPPHPHHLSTAEHHRLPLHKLAHALCICIAHPSPRPFPRLGWAWLLPSAQSCA